MPIQYELDAVLADGQLEDQDAKCEAIEERLIPEFGWDAVRAAIINLLESDRCKADYEVAAAVLWGAVLDKRHLPADRIIALLYDRFAPKHAYDDNLVWSITSKLKGVGYLSEYNPLEDSAVLCELDSIRKRREGA